jgi:hypothetical protein
MQESYVPPHVINFWRSLDSVYDYILSVSALYMTNVMSRRRHKRSMPVGVADGSSRWKYAD